MKKALLITIVSGLLLSGQSLAAGYSADGRVDVFTSGSNQYIQGNMSVRYNPSATSSSYVLANGYLNSTVSFSGRDDDGDYFYCYVSTSDPNYQAAVDAKNNLTNGGRLYARKVIGGDNSCTLLSVGNYSYFLD